MINSYTKKAIRDRVKALVENGRIAELSDIIQQIAKLAEGEPKDESEEFTLDQGANVARFLQDIPTDVAFQALGTFGVLNKMNTAFSPISLNDKRDIPEQWKLLKKMEEAIKADPNIREKAKAAAPTP